MLIFESKLRQVFIVEHHLFGVDMELEHAGRIAMYQVGKKLNQVLEPFENTLFVYFPNEVMQQSAHLIGSKMLNISARYCSHPKINTYVSPYRSVEMYEFILKKAKACKASTVVLVTSKRGIRDLRIKFRDYFEYYRTAYSPINNGNAHLYFVGTGSDHKMEYLQEKTALCEQ